MTTCYDQAGRVATVRNGGIVSSDIYAGVGQGTGLGGGTVEGYSALGGLQRLVLGGTLTRQWDYNNRGQMEKLWLSHTPAGGTIAPKMRLELGYANGTNNGNVASQTIYVGGNRVATQNYVYDAVNRLKSAQEGTAWKETNGFDSRGNRWVDEANTSGLPLLPNEVPKGSTWFDTKNRLVNVGAGFGYDNAGNLTAVASMSRAFEYDVENRQVVAVVNGKRTQYSYDGEGRRVMKLECPGTSVCTGATTGAKKTVFVYDAGGKLAQEYGELAPATLRSYVFDDHLGSTRMKLSGAGVVEGWWDYLPFGGEIPGALSGRNAVAGFAYGCVRPSMMFTGKERDAETGLDYFGARYMSAAQGRFMGADAPFADQDAVDPQSWTLYSYTRNNPLRFVDDDGRGVLDGLKNFVNHTGSTFVRAVLEPEKFFPQVAKGVSERLSDPAKLASDIGTSVENFSNASPDEKVTVITEVVLDVGLAVITGGASRGESLVTVGKVEVKEGVIKPSLKTLASEIRESGNHNASRNQRTVAVAEDSKGGLHVASSNGLDSGQKKAVAAKGVKCVKCKKGSHAEENIMREVPDARRIGTSKRQPCGPSEHNCAAQLAERGIIVEE